MRRKYVRCNFHIRIYQIQNKNQEKPKEKEKEKGKEKSDSEEKEQELSQNYMKYIIYVCFKSIKIQYGKYVQLCSVFSKRRGEIINGIRSEESIKSIIESIIPVTESFGFVEEIRKKSSGLAIQCCNFISEKCFMWTYLFVELTLIQKRLQKIL